MSRQTIARIQRSALTHNLAALKRYAPDSLISAVVKADGYGHGLERVVDALSAADQFAVATLGEAQRLRAAGWRGSILLLEGFANQAELELAFKLSAEMVLHHPFQLELLKAQPQMPRERIWLKFDSGMHRLGFPLQEVDRVYQALLALIPQQQIGLMTHFACADDPFNPMTAEQIIQFNSATEHLTAPRSLANSAAILNFPASHADYVRPGIALYGISPCADKLAADFGLRPAMTLSCELIGINQCRAGDSVGYGAAFTCPVDMPVGIAAIGYGDGYPWHAKTGTPVLVGGQSAQLIGRVSMDMVNVDLRGIEQPEIGDQVTLWGEGLPVEVIAQHAGSIPWELVCGVTARVKMEEV